MQNGAKKRASSPSPPVEFLQTAFCIVYKAPCAVYLPAQPRLDRALRPPLRLDAQLDRRRAPIFAVVVALRLAADTRTLVGALLQFPGPSKERIGTAIDLMKSEPSLYTRHMELFNAIRQDMQDVIVRRLEHERSAAAARPELIAMAVFHIARWATTLWHEAGSTGHPREYIDAAYGDLYAVLGPPPSG